MCGGATRDASNLLNLLGQLVDKSLVAADGTSEGSVCYRMLETIRRYALEHLAASEAAESSARGHFDYYLALAEQIEPELRGAAQIAWLRRLEREHDNLRTALQWAIDSAQAELGLRLAGALWRFWWARGYLKKRRPTLVGGAARCYRESTNRGW